MIGMDGKRELGNSVLSAQLDEHEKLLLKALIAY